MEKSANQGSGARGAITRESLRSLARSISSLRGLGLWRDGLDPSLGARERREKGSDSLSFFLALFSLAYASPSFSGPPPPLIAHKKSLTNIGRGSSLRQASQIHMSLLTGWGIFVFLLRYAPRYGIIMYTFNQAWSAVTFKTYSNAN